MPKTKPIDPELLRETTQPVPEAELKSSRSPAKKPKIDRMQESLEFLFMLFLEESTKRERAFVRRAFTMWQNSSDTRIDQAFAELVKLPQIPSDIAEDELITETQRELVALFIEHLRTLPEWPYQTHALWDSKEYGLVRGLLERHFERKHPSLPAGWNMDQLPEDENETFHRLMWFAAPDGRPGLRLKVMAAQKALSESKQKYLETCAAEGIAPDPTV